MSDPDVSKEDTIIAIYGATGSGKSTLIEKLTGRVGLSGDGVESVTSEVTPFRYKQNGKSLVFVDTPGFDDTHKTDLEVLKMLADWLRKTYNKAALLSGLLYIHPIASIRFSGSARKNLRMFEQLCGKGALHKVVLLTTMWDLVPENVARKREGELKQKFWRPMMDRGMRYARLEPSTREFAWTTLDNFMYESRAAPSVILLQQELGMIGRRLNETAAGKELYKELEELLKRHKQLAQDVGQGDGTRDSNAEIQEVQTKLETTITQVRAMKIPMHRRIISAFSKKASLQ